MKKRCSKCGKIKLIDKFQFNRYYKDDRDSTCRVCRKLMRVKNVQRIQKERKLLHIPEFKVCEICGKTKKIICFCMDKRNKDGYCGYCLLCNRQRQLARDPDCDKKRYNKIKNDPEYKKAAAERSMAWQKNNPERKAAINRKYYINNKEACDANGRKWAKENPERLRELNRERYIRQKERMLKLGKIWRKTESGKRSQKAYQASRAKVGYISVTIIREIEQANIKKYGILTCEYCKVPVGDKYHLEHKIPIVRGGKTKKINLCIACPPCNLSKGKLTADEYRERLKVV